MSTQLTLPETDAETCALCGSAEPGGLWEFSREGLRVRLCSDCGLPPRGLTLAEVRHWIAEERDHARRP